MDNPLAVLHELQAIKALLALAVVAMGVMAATFVFFVRSMLAAVRHNAASRASNARADELDELLASGQNTAARFSAAEWLASEPRRKEAHGALARAHYQLGELAEAKQVLTGLLKVSPEEPYRVQAWLDLVESEFSEKRPRPV